MIGKSDFFSFALTTLNWKLFYKREQKVSYKTVSSTSEDIMKILDYFIILMATKLAALLAATG